MKLHCIRVFHDKEIWRISVRLSDRSEVTQHKITFVKNFPPLRFEPMTSWSSVSCSSNWARKEYVGDFWCESSFVSCTTSHVGLCLFLESIEHDFIKAQMIDTDNRIVTYLSLQRIRLMIWRLWVQTSLGTIFDKIYFVLSNFRSVR